MLKYIKHSGLLIALCSCLLSLNAVAQSYQRKSQKPNFFMPNQARQATQLSQDPQLNNVIRQQVARQTKEKTAKQTAQQQKNTAQQTTAPSQVKTRMAATPQPNAESKTSNQPQRKNVTVARPQIAAPVRQKTAAVARPQSATPVQSSKTASAQKIATAAKKNTQPATNNTPKQPTAVEQHFPITVAQISDDTQNQDYNPFDLLWADYQRDLIAISKNQQLNNQRLQKVLAEFNGEDHVL